MSAKKTLTPEEFAEKATDVLCDSLSKLPEEEQDRRLRAFKAAARQARSSAAKRQRRRQTQPSRDRILTQAETH